VSTTQARRGIGGHHRGYRGKSDVWLTPPEIIQAIGPFDLDPCACASSPWASADVLYTEGGLDREWFGRVWLNPPYGPQLGKWLGKLAKHGNGIAIAFARTETRAFFDHVWPKATGLLFIRGRLHFHHADGTRAKANAGGPSVLIAYGEENAEWLEHGGIVGQFVRLKFAEGPSPEPARVPTEAAA
jgi:hypothetical protein